MRKIIGISMIVALFIGIFVVIGIVKGVLFSLMVFGLTIVLCAYIYVAVRIAIGSDDD